MPRTANRRHLAQWELQPIAAALAEKASAKLGEAVTLDVMRPLQAFHAGRRARAMVGVVQALALAKDVEIFGTRKYPPFDGFSAEGLLGYVF